MAWCPRRPAPGRRGRTCSSARRCCGRSPLLPDGDRATCCCVSVRLPVRLDRGRHSIAKKYAAAGRHCHSWPVGFEILDRARDEPLRAFSLGYLAHLAADVVAHNYFVPRQLAITSSTSRRWAQLLGEPLRDAPRRRGAAARARAHPAGPLPQRRAPRPDPEPHDLQHAHESADLPRDGAASRTWNRGSAIFQLDVRAAALGPAGRRGRARTSAARSTT